MSRIVPRGHVEEVRPALKDLYTGEPLPVIGELNVQVRYEEQENDLALTVVAGDGPSLLGRDWLQHIKLNWREIKAVATHAIRSLEYLLDKYGDIFTDELGTIKGHCAKLQCEAGRETQVFQITISSVQ